MLSPNKKSFFFIHLAVTLSFCAACEEQPAAPAATAQAPEDGNNNPEGDPATKTEQPFKPTHTELMDQNFDYVSSMIDAVIAGDTQTARAYTARLAHMKTEPSGNAAWDKRLGMIPFRAQIVADEKDAALASEMAPIVLTACAECHTQITGPKPFPPDDPPVPLKASPRVLKKIPARRQMEQHQWANDRLFDGVYYPDPASWEAGARAWASAAMVHPEESKRVKKRAKKMIKKAKAIDLLGAKDIAARASAYGKLLTTCTSCHQKLKVKVKPPAMPEPLQPSAP